MFINPTTKRILDTYLTFNLAKSIAKGGAKMAINVFKGGKIALNFGSVKKGVDFFWVMEEVLFKNFQE